jgi:hypothetical protein
VHLNAALAVWKYCDTSVRYLFGTATGDPLADEIEAALLKNPQGMTRTDIREHFYRHRKGADIAAALSTLYEQSKAYRRIEGGTGGRAAERWFAGCDPERGAQSAKSFVGKTAFSAFSATAKEP